MKRSSTRILTTHTGSLPRPAAVFDALRARGADTTADPSFAAVTRDAVAEVVGRQRAVGIDVVNDGEVGKWNYATYVTDRLAGFGGESRGQVVRSDLADFPAYRERLFAEERGMARRLPACVGAVSHLDLEPLTTEIANLSAATAGLADDVFMTAASPGVISFWLENQYYATHDDYVEALADAMKPEYDEIHRAGFVLQLDCPDLTLRLSADDTVDTIRQRARLHVDAINQATRDVPCDAMRLHLCWGNYEGPHHHDIPLRDLIDIALGARPNAISFEGANPRHAHEWTVFEDLRLPDGTVLIPGIVDTSTNYIEHPQLIAQRITRYADLVGRENVMAGTDCGFSTVADYHRVDPEISWAKLAAAVEGAQIASASLW